MARQAAAVKMAAKDVGLPLAPNASDWKVSYVAA